MNLLLSRHGNTFDPGQTPTWAGSRNDLRLVKAGFEQAKRLGQTLKAAGLKPAAVYCGPLRRTRHYAELVIQELGIAAPHVDPRLNELDYGDWSGLPEAEVRARFGDDEVRGWNERSLWPAQGRWGGSEAAAAEQARSFAADIAARHRPDDLILAVSSNGKLRYFLKLVPGEWEKRVQAGAFKTKTGHVAKLRHQGGAWSLDYWDREPKPGEPL